MWLILIVGWIMLAFPLACIVGRMLKGPASDPVPVEVTFEFCPNDPDNPGGGPRTIVWVQRGDTPPVKVSDEVWETPLGQVSVTVHQPTPVAATSN